MTLTNWSNPHVNVFGEGPEANFFWVKLGFAPDSIRGLQFTFSPNQGSSPFGFPGEFNLMAFFGTYDLSASSLGGGSSGGSYSYRSTGDSNATLTLDDEVSGAIAGKLVFDDKKSGRFSMSSRDGEQNGEFVMECRSDACLSLGL